MAKQVGSYKTGGRKKGTPNKRTLHLFENLNSVGLDVISKLSEILPQLPIEKQADVLLELMPYIYPKRKAIELSTVADDNEIKINMEFFSPDGTLSHSEELKVVGERK